MRLILLAILVNLYSCSDNSRLKKESSIELASQSEIESFLELYNTSAGDKINFLSFSDKKWHKKPYFLISSEIEESADRSLYLLDLDEDKDAEYVYFELDQGSSRYDFVKIFKETDGKIHEIDYTKSYEEIIREDYRIKHDTIINYIPEGMRNTYFSPLKFPIVSMKNGKTRIHWNNITLEYGKNGVTVVNE